uniref:Uncharacterized protein TCIL3000_6_2050 n=1 Tax=Trypanosoma congolense (strain IL3000) TaxID=1068625 RepID=G0UNK6_TRYCI|nr:unnamed protein product [Trypanosoma congolense IL3000]
MLRRLSTRLVTRAQRHEELAKMLRDGPPVLAKAPVAGEGCLTFRDVRVVSSGEAEEAKRRRLLYQSTYRGMTEMDIILGAYARRHIQSLSSPQLQEYDTILRHFDNDLYKWLVMDEVAPAELVALPTYQSLHRFVRDEREQLLKCAN